MVDKKLPNLVENWGKKSKDQSYKKSLKLIGDWGGKPEDQWQCTAYK